MSFSRGILTAFALTCLPAVMREYFSPAIYRSIAPFVSISVGRWGNGGNHERPLKLPRRLRYVWRPKPIHFPPRRKRSEWSAGGRRISPGNAWIQPALAALRGRQVAPVAFAPPAVGPPRLLLLVFGRPETFSVARRRPRPTPGQAKKDDCVSGGPSRKAKWPCKGEANKSFGVGMA